jgi:hypothetical protein
MLIVNKHVSKIVHTLNEEHLFIQNKEIIEECLSDKWSDYTKFTMYLTVGQFKNLTGFYGSLALLKELTSVYVGRFLRAYSLNRHPLSQQQVFEVMKLVDPIEDKAVIRLQKYFIEKLGLVSEERTKELDEIAQTWSFQSVMKLEEIAQGGSFEQKSSN